MEEVPVHGRARGGEGKGGRLEVLDFRFASRLAIVSRF